MAKTYSGKYRDDLDKEDDQEQTPNTGETGVQQDKTVAALSPQEQTWEKRYADLRRHDATKEAGWNTERQELKRQVAELMSSQVKLPKSDEELEEWKKQYPDGAAFVETLARKIAEEKAVAIRAETSEQLKELNKAKHDTIKERAYQELLKLQPDFETIIADEKFKEWIKTKSKKIYSSLYENDTDYQAASESIDLYRLETEKAIVKKATPIRGDKAAALAVTTSGPSPEPTTSIDGRKIWKESEIAKLNPREYDQLDEQITIAYHEGRVLNDMTKAR